MNIILFFLVCLQMSIAQSSKLPSKPFCAFEKDQLRCQKHLPDILYPSNLTRLELRNTNWETLDIDDIVRKFPNLENLTVYNSDIADVIPPENATNIKVLQLRKLLLTNITSTFLRNFPAIQVFNIEENHIKALDNDFFLGNLKELRLKDNKWDCSDDLEWLLKLNPDIIKDLDDLVCHGNPHPGKPLLPIAQFLKDIKEQCTEKCECFLSNVPRDPATNMLEPMTMVSCVNKSFTALPTTLPKKTKILHLENNSIDSLEPLKTNPAYGSLLELYLDNNKIRSVAVLEGSHWLTHFRVFSLKGNNLRKLPAYVLDNALEKNINMPKAVQIFLGGNPWRCDCVFTPVFQEMVLQKYAPQVKDIKDVKCARVKGDENSLRQISELSRSSVCYFPTEYSVQEALDVLNAVLASMIIFILGKLAYDYYYFKKTGKLPWIVTKMP